LTNYVVRRTNMQTPCSSSSGVASDVVPK